MARGTTKGTAPRPNPLPSHIPRVPPSPPPFIVTFCLSGPIRVRCMRRCQAWLIHRCDVDIPSPPRVLGESVRDLETLRKRQIMRRIVYAGAVASWSSKLSCLWHLFVSLYAFCFLIYLAGCLFACLVSLCGFSVNLIYDSLVCATKFIISLCHRSLCQAHCLLVSQVYASIQRSPLSTLGMLGKTTRLDDAYIFLLDCCKSSFSVFFCQCVRLQ